MSKTMRGSFKREEDTPGNLDRVPSPEQCSELIPGF